MTGSEAIAINLPYLRRFARALTGSQEAGDAYAVATLEAILAEQPPTPREEAEAATGGAKHALFRTFLRIWGSLSVNRVADSAEALAADRGLEAMTPMPRVAFLLSALEGFDPGQIATLLDLPETEVRSLIDRAGQEIAAHIQTDVLIIEDELIIALDLEAVVGELGLRVSEIARTRAEAVAAVARQRPGLVLADIHLADGSSGLDAVNDILGGMELPVIFITAYPERLLTGERPEPTFLITKPFRIDTVKAIISQALFFDRRARLPRAATAGPV